jgi:hypothetical protein
MSNETEDQRMLIKALFEFKGATFARCFAPGPPCTRPAIRAHSVQNAGCLDLLVRDGHVVALTHRLDLDRGVIVDFAEVGRNRATTFTGLCDVHDHQLFAAIEAQPLDLEDQHHLFLLAYRAVLFELHATCAAGWLLQAAYQKRVGLGLDPKDQPSPAGIYAVERMVIAYETNSYKEQFDRAMVSADPDFLAHDVLLLDVRPTVAASALFTLDGVANHDGDVIRVCLTVLPIGEARTVAVLSYLSDDAGLARAHLQRVITAAGEHQHYELSRRILNHCSNFVLAPTIVEEWSSEKRKAIVEYFRRTIFVSDLEYENPDLLLFERAA